MEPLVPEFLKEAAYVFARAFVNDPLYVFFFPDERTRKRKIECLYRFLLRVELVNTWVSSSLLEGVAIWKDPYNYKGDMSALQCMRAVGLVFCLGFGALGRMIVFAWNAFRLQKKLMSTEAFWLKVIAVDPACQKKGVGSMMIQEFLKKADQKEGKVFLETQNPIHISFYERFGFYVLSRTKQKDLEHIVMKRDGKRTRFLQR